MKNIRRLINKTIIEITFLIVMCIVSFVVFNNVELTPVIDNVVYTDVDVIRNNDYIGINDFTNDAQIVLNVYNESNTKEDFRILLTSDTNLSSIDDCLKIKIADQEYLLKDLKVADNYYLIDKGNLKAGNKEISIYIACLNTDALDLNQLDLSFVNDLTI